MRRQSKRLSRKYLGRNDAGNVILYVLISFHSRDVSCTLSRLFVRPGFRLFCARLAAHYLGVYSVLGSLIQQALTGGNEYNGSVSLRYNSLFISLPLFTKDHKTTTLNSYILHIRENVNYTTANF